MSDEKKDSVQRGADSGQAAFQGEVGEWADRVMKESTNGSICKHLLKEVKELAVSCEPEEAADCFLILLHFAHRNHFDLLTKAREKHEICKTRKWGQPDEDGVVEHIREPDGQAAELQELPLTERVCEICEHKSDSSVEYCGSCTLTTRDVGNWKEAGWHIEQRLSKSQAQTIDDLTAQLAAAQAELERLKATEFDKEFDSVKDMLLEKDEQTRIGVNNDDVDHVRPMVQKLMRILDAYNDLTAQLAAIHKALEPMGDWYPVAPDAEVVRLAVGDLQQDRADVFRLKRRLAAAKATLTKHGIHYIGCEGGSACTCGLWEGKKQEQKGGDDD